MLRRSLAVLGLGERLLGSRLQDGGNGWSGFTRTAKGREVLSSVPKQVCVKSEELKHSAEHSAAISGGAPP